MTLTGIEFGTPGSPARPGATPVAVPPVVGELRADAETTLKKFGFRPVANEVEAEGDEDKVYAQDPMPPTTRPRGSVVTIFVIKNPSPNIDARFTALDEAVKGVLDAVGKVETEVAKVETAAEAKKRVEELKAELKKISDKLDKLPGPTQQGAPASQSPTKNN
jgi:hypothetical protein